MHFKKIMVAILLIFFVTTSLANPPDTDCPNLRSGGHNQNCVIREDLSNQHLFNLHVTDALINAPTNESTSLQNMTFTNVDSENESGLPLQGTYNGTWRGGHFYRNLLGTNLTGLALIADINHILIIGRQNQPLIIHGRIVPHGEILQLGGGERTPDSGGLFTQIHEVILDVVTTRNRQITDTLLERFAIYGAILGYVEFQTATTYRDFEIWNFFPRRDPNQETVIFPMNTHQIATATLGNITLRLPDTAYIENVRMWGDTRVHFYNESGMVARFILPQIIHERRAAVRVHMIQIVAGRLMINNLLQTTNNLPQPPAPHVEEVTIEARIPITITDIDQQVNNSNNGVTPVLTLAGAGNVGVMGGAIQNLNAVIMAGNEGQAGGLEVIAATLAENAHMHVQSAHKGNGINQFGGNLVNVVIARTRINNGMTIHNDTGSNFKSIRNVVKGDVQVSNN